MNKPPRLASHTSQAHGLAMQYPGKQRECARLVAAALGVALGMPAPIASAGLLSDSVGSFKVAADLSRRSSQEGAVKQAAAIITTIIASAADTDGDSFPEPLPFVTGSGPVGGGLVPVVGGIPQSDGHGARLGYCAWNNGTANGASANLLAGSTNDNGAPVFAVVSSGLDNVFNRSCAEIFAGTNVSNDDFVVAKSTTQIRQGVGGTVYFGDPVLDMAALTTALGVNAKDGELRLVKSDNTLWRWNTIGPAANTWTSASNTYTASNVFITGGSINNTQIGNTTPSTGAFTTLSASTSFTTPNVIISGGSIDGTAIGATVASSGVFTTLAATGAFSVAGNATIGGTLNTTGSITAASFSGSGAALTNLNGSAINSGVVGTAFGGTGINASTAPAGSLLIGTGSGFTLGALAAGAGIGITSGPGSITIANTGVTSLAGTANQVNVSSATGAVVLSLPQSIAATSTPTFAGQTLTGALTGTTASFSGAVTTGGSIIVANSGTTTPLNQVYFGPAAGEGTDITSLGRFNTTANNSVLQMTLGDDPSLAVGAGGDRFQIATNETGTPNVRHSFDSNGNAYHAGGLTVNGKFTNGGATVYTMVRPLGCGTVSSDIGNFFAPGSNNGNESKGGLMVRMTVTSSDFFNVAARTYLFPIGNNTTNGAWQIVGAQTRWNLNGGNDYELDINTSGSNTSLRLRATAGCNTAYPRIQMEVVGDNYTFTESTATSAPAAPTAFYGLTAITSNGSNVGMGTGAPQNRLDITNNTRAGSHATGRPLYVTGNVGAYDNGVEFRHSSGTQGIGVGFNGIYAAGSDANQDIGLVAKGTSGVYFRTNGAERMRLDASGNLSTTGDITPGGKIVVQNGQDGGPGRGIYFLDAGNSDWGTYMGTAGVGKSLSGGTAVASLDARTGQALRSRIFNNFATSFVWENSSNQALMSLTGDTGNLFTKGNIVAGGTVTATSFSGNGSGMTNLNGSNINSGMVGVTYGGTGVNGSAAANGSLLIGNGTGYTLANLTGTTSQLIVTNSAGGITLSLPQSIAAASTPTFAGQTLTGALSGTSATFSNSLNLAAGTATVAPLRLQTGANLTAPSFGAVEFDGTSLYLTNNSATPTRKTVAYTDSIMTGGTSGNAATATQLQTARTIAASGDATWSVNFDGSANVTAPLTLANTTVVAGAYGSGTQIGQFTVDAKGRLTAASNVTVTPDWANITSIPAQVTALGGLATNGLIARTAAGTLAARTLAAGSTKLSVTNGDGVLGDPTLDIVEANLTLDNIGGTLSPAKGGTGVNGATAANGQLLIGNGTGYTLANIAGSTGLSVTNGTGTITLANTGVTSFNTRTGAVVLSKADVDDVASFGTRNFTLGRSSLSSASTGSDNSAIGSAALLSNTSGSSNSAIGSATLVSNTSGSNNSTIGFATLNRNTTGSNNTAMGYSASAQNTFGFDNTAVGFGALASNTSGSLNTALGKQAGNATSAGSPTNANITGSNNTFLGASAMPGTVTQLNYATALGSDALVNTSNTIVLGRAIDNTVIGAASDDLSTNKLQVTGGIKGTGDLTIGGAGNFTGAVSAASFSGNGAGMTNLNGSNINSGMVGVTYGGTGVNGSAAANGSLLIGNGTGYTLANLTGTPNQVNVVNGAGAITLSLPQSIATTSTPTFAGQTLTGALTGTTANFSATVTAPAYAGASMRVNGTNNTGVGLQALQAVSTGIHNSGFGANSLQAVTTGGYNTGVGSNSLALNVSGNLNNAIGYQSLYGNVSGNSNNALGYLALAATAASNNSAVGDRALTANTAGSANVALGRYAGYATSGNTTTNANTTGSNNTFLGASAMPGTATQLNYATALGSDALVNTSNTIVLGRAIDNTVIGAASDDLSTNKLQVTGGIKGTGNLTIGGAGNFTGAVSAASFSGNGSGMTNLNGSNINSGMVGVTYGGTGVNGSAAANGSLLIGNGTGYTLANLTGSTGLSVTNGTGTITLANTGVTSFNTRTGAVALTLADVNGVTSFSGSNVTLGSGALPTSSAGVQNTAIGVNALSATAAGTTNVAIGFNTLMSNTTGSNNTGVGQGALQSATANGNTAIGRFGLFGNTSGGNNLAMGMYAGYQTSAAVATNANTTGSNNIFLGAFALPGTATQLNYASVIGSDATITTSNTVVLGRTTDNTVIGATGDDASGNKLQVTGGIKGTGNLTIGGAGNFTGAVSAASFSGNGAGMTNLNGSNINSGMVGVTYGGTGVNGSAAANGRLLIGNGTGYTLANITGSTGLSVTNGTGTITLANTGVTSFNTRTGAVALTLADVNGVTSFSGSNVTLGSGALPTSSAGVQNTAIGVNALSATAAGTTNVAIGFNTLMSNTTGSNNTGVGQGALQSATANGNTAIGRFGLSGNTSGGNNLAMGMYAGYQTSAAVATNANTTGSNNIFLGAFALPGTATQLNYASVIGSDATITTSNTVVLGRTTDNTVIGATGDDASGNKLQVTGGIKGTGNLTIGGTGTFTGAVSTGALTATTGTYSGVLAANGGLTATTGTFSGVLTAPTAAVDTSTTQVATTAYVINQNYIKTSRVFDSANSSVSLNGNATPVGSATVSIGYGANGNNAGNQFSTAVGANANGGGSAQNVAIGRNSLAVANGGYNVSVGQSALTTATGTFNTALGHFAGVSGGISYAGSSNTLIGSATGDLPATGISGSNNTLLGASAKLVSGALSFGTAIGSDGRVSTSNTVVLGRASTYSAGVPTGGDKTVIGATGDSGAAALLQVNGASQHIGMASAPTGTAGMQYYNSGTNQFQYYNGTSWQNMNAGTPLSSLTAATASNTINNVANAQTWNWQLAGNTTGFAIGETAASAGGTGTQYLAKIGTLTGSTAIPLSVSALGVEAFRVNSNGNILVGSSTDDGSGNKLQVTGGIKGTGNLTIGGTGNFTGAVSAASFSGNGAGMTNLNGSNINSGMVGVTYGGTGVNGSAAANGSLLIGNGTGYTLANLTGTPNQVNVVNGAGAITLSLPQNIATSSTPTFAGQTLTGNLAGTTASFSGAVSSARMNVTQASGVAAIVVTGTGMGGGATDNTNGIVFGLGVNGGVGNRQIWFGATEGVGNAANSMLRLVAGSNIASIDAVVGNDTARLPLNIGSVDTNVAIGNPFSAYNVALPGKFSIFAEAAKKGLVVRSAASQTGSLMELQNSAGTSLFTVDAAGNSSMAGNFSAGGTGTFTGAVSAASFSGSGSGMTNLNGSNINSGMVGVTYGGTGVNGSTAANGQLLIGNGTGYTLANVTAGTGISVTNGTGSITVANTGVTSFNTRTGAVALVRNDVDTTSIFAASPGAAFGEVNMAIGLETLTGDTPRAANLAIGHKAMMSMTSAVTYTLASQGSYNTGIGHGTLQKNTTGASNNAFGYGALQNNTTGTSNVGLGINSLQNSSTGNSNTGIGANVLRNSTGSANTALGVNAGFATSATVTSNANTTGSNNTFLGSYAMPGTATQLSYATALGSDALVSTSDTIVLGRATDNTVIGAASDDGSGNKLQVTGGIRAIGTLEVIGAGAPIDSQGAYVQWNRVSGGGKTYLINQKGAGPGGIVFGESTTGNVLTQTMAVDAVGNFSTVGSMTGTAGNFSGVLTASGGSKISVQNFQDGGLGRGIYMYGDTNTDWGLYMSSAGVGKSMSGGTSPNALDGRAGFHMRSRSGNGFSQGFIWENQSEVALMSLAASTGNLSTLGSVTAASYVTTSDQRLKENIIALDRSDMLQRLKQLNGYQYNLISNPNKTQTYGVLAQEILKLFPNTVSMGGNGYYAVDYGALSAVTATAVGQLAINMEKLGIDPNGGPVPEGSLMIGNGQGFTVGTLTADTGISITNAAGKITIKNTGVTGFNGRTGNVTLGLADINAAAGFGNGNYTAGTNAMATTASGSFNTAVGQGALGAIGSGAGNSAQGFQALFGNTNGANNVGLGRQAGYADRNGVAANANVSGSNNTFLGAYAMPGSAQQLNYATAIGSDAVVTTSNTLVLGRSNDVTVLGATGDDGSGERLQVTGNIKATGSLLAKALALTSSAKNGLWIDNGGTAGVGNGLIKQGDSTMLFAQGAINSAAGLVIGPWASGSAGLRIDGNGVAVAGTLNVSGAINGNAAFASASDARFKKDVAPIADAMSVIEQLQGVRFSFDQASFPSKNFEAGRQLGFIAQQIESILPEVVRTDSEGYKSVQYSQLTPLLVEGMKAQQAILKHMTLKDPATLLVDIKTFQANDAVFENIKATNIKVAVLEAETARIKKLDADSIESKSVRSDVVKSGELEVFVSMGTFQPMFTPQVGSQYIVNATADDGSTAFASVAFMAGGTIKVTPISGSGFDVTAMGAQVGLVASSKKIKATWIRMS